MYRNLQDLCSSFSVPKRYLPSRRNLRRSASAGDAGVLLTSWTAKSYVWALLQEMSENANAPVVSSSILFTQSWLIFVTLLSRLDMAAICTCCHQDQDVQNVLDVRLTWCNVDGVNVNSRSHCSEVLDCVHVHQSACCGRTASIAELHRGFQVLQ